MTDDEVYQTIFGWPNWPQRLRRRPPLCTTNCVDCGIGTITAKEFYMVKDDVWEQAWHGRRKWWYRKVYGQEVLCIGCLEERIGRTLTKDDFTDAPVNDLVKRNMSDRFFDRRTRMS
jgi:hypothetical protein